jgi:hypothetical protein
MENFNVQEGLHSRQRCQVVMVQVQFLQVGEAVGYPVDHSNALVVEVHSSKFIVLGMLPAVQLEVLAQHKIYCGRQ